MDDEKPFLEVVIAGLAMALPTAQVVTAPNGFRALEVLNTAHVDLVITDLKMPVMDGFRFIEELRQRKPRLEVIVMSVFDGPEALERLSRLGVTRLLSKPFELSALLDAINDDGLKGRTSFPIQVQEPPDEQPEISKHILVMDDDPTFLQVTGMMIAGWGHRVRLAGTGEEAVDLFKEGLRNGDPYDVVLLDLIVYRGMGGEAAVRLIHEADPLVPVILITGSSESPVFRDYRRYGFQTALTKPFPGDKLHAAIRGAGKRGEQKTGFEQTDNALHGEDVRHHE